MKLSDFDYHLPEAQIAQAPIEPRDSAKLMILNRSTAQRQHSQFSNILEFLNPGDILVMNHTRVLPARLKALKVPSGGKAEILLLERVAPQQWKALVGGKGLAAGKQLELEDTSRVEILKELHGPQRLIRFDQPIQKRLQALGQPPLPPYIHSSLEDPERYQTVYAREPGSAAAPTAGLHFTSALLDKIQKAGVSIAYITLHIGLDTFAPVTEEDPNEHIIHQEWCQLTPKSAESINNAKAAGGRIIAVGTTSVRLLETAALKASTGDLLAPFEGNTDLFILPGYQFRAVDAMITNFHLPRSTLLMLVSAFAGRESILKAYQDAVDSNYRFFSFGDAMLIR